MNDAPVVSVVIPSYNSSGYVRGCIQSLLAQKTKLPFEIILVDSSDDGADRVVAAEFPQVRLLHYEERRDVGTARNIGIEHARGDIVLFLDTDCIANPDWIDQLAGGIRALSADGVGGSFKNGTPRSMSGCIAYYLEFFRSMPCNAEPNETPFLVGGNSGFKRNIFEIAQYPDHSTGDDWAFNWELVKKSKRLFFLPAAAVEHLNKTGMLRVLRYQYKLGSGAYRYRSLSSPGILNFLKRIPLLVFLMPIVMLPQIAATVLKRRGILEFLKVVGLLPAMLAANTVWAAGFYHEMKGKKSI